MTMPLFSFEQLKFSYPGGKNIFYQAEFAFHAAQKIGFCGPNGCGKSTLFQLITGLLKPGAGHIFFQGQKLKNEKDFRALRQQVGLVLQNAEDQLFHPTVLEDVAFGPLNLGLGPKQARERALETLEQLGLSDLQQRLNHQLSGGEKRLVALAAVLSMRPQVLLLDEPTNDLDPQHRQKLITILNSLPAGRIIISHDFSFLQQTCNEYMGIHNQKLILSDSPQLHQHFHIHPLGDTPHSHEGME